METLSIAELKEWIANATVDGWDILRQTETNDKLEAELTWHTSHGMFKAFIYSNRSTQLAVYDPDNCVVRVSPEYVNGEIIHNFTSCYRCGASEELVRFGYAEKVCKSCFKKYNSVTDIGR